LKKSIITLNINKIKITLYKTCVLIKMSLKLFYKTNFSFLTICPDIAQPNLCQVPINYRLSDCCPFYFRPHCSTIGSGIFWWLRKSSCTTRGRTSYFQDLNSSPNNNKVIPDFGGSFTTKIF
jgi:hypothetical protein